MKLIHGIVAVVVLSTPVFAQEPAATTPGTRGGQAAAAKVVSPEVLADGRVTFRLFAPKATEVLLQGNWPNGRGAAMTKDASGLWSVTTAALQPELWGTPSRLTASERWTLATTTSRAMVWGS